MHVDKWVKIGVVFGGLTVIPSYWELFHPLIRQYPVATHVDPQMDWIRFATILSPIISSAFLALAVWMAFGRKSSLESKRKGGSPQFWSWIGRLQAVSAEATIIKEDLERLEYEWSKSGVRLDYPLSDSTLPSPDQPLSYLQRELLGFRFIYRWHLDNVDSLKMTDFYSLVMEHRFPCSADAHNLRKMLELHANALITRASDLSKTVAEVTEGL